MNDSLRSLHVISRLDGYGGSRALRQIAVRQAGLGQGASVAALGAEASIVRELRAAGVVAAELGARWRYDPLAVSRLFALRRDAPFDLVHAWDPTALAYATLTGRRTPLVATWKVAGLDSWVARITRQGVAALPIGAPPVTPSPRSREQALAELGVPADAQLIAVAGPLVRDKQFDEAIWDFELVRVLYPRARMVVFGDGPDRARLERYASLVSEQGCVQFAGFRADLAELLPHVDVFWQRDAPQTTPYALLEALAAGVPAVATDVPAHLAIITPGETGYLVAPGHRAGVARATDELLSDASRARRIGAAAAARVARDFSMEKVLGACDALYHAAKTRSLTRG